MPDPKTFSEPRGIEENFFGLLEGPGACSPGKGDVRFAAFPSHFFVYEV